MPKHTLNPLLAYEPKVPKSPEPLHTPLYIREKIQVCSGWYLKFAEN